MSNKSHTNLFPAATDAATRSIKLFILYDDDDDAGNTETKQTQAQLLSSTLKNRHLHISLSVLYAIIYINKQCFNIYMSLASRR